MKKIVTVSVLAVLALLIASSPAMALSSYWSAFNNLYKPGGVGSSSGTNASCNLCHSSGGGTDLNGYGKDWATQHNTGLTPAAAFQAIESLNSDAASVSNIAEINASAQPGWTSGANNQLYDIFALTPTVTASAPAITGNLLDPVAANQPPVLNPIGNKSVNEGQALTFTATATDPDGNALTFSGGNLPTGATLNATTGAFSWTPTSAQAGNYTVTITVTDNGSPALTDSETITITVGNVNRPPVLGAIAPQSGFEGTLLTFTATATDPDGDALTFSGSNLPTGASVSATGTFSWTPTFAQAGSYTVNIIVTDNGTPTPQSASQAVTITIGNTNRPPVLSPSPIGNRTVNEGQTLTIALSATDPDGDPLSFTGANLPNGATLVDNLNGSATFSWTPSFAQAGNYPNVTLTVSDGALTDSEIFTITVGDVNRPPVLNPIGNKTVNEGQALTFTATASDPDGGALTFSSTTLPSGATLNATTGAFSWTPSFTQAGNYSVTVIVTDAGGLTDQEAITITVGNVNRPPVLNPIGNKTVNENQLLTFTATATDPDGGALTFSSTTLPSGATLSPTGAFSWTPSFSQAGNYSVTVSVSDGALSASETITITVGNVNRPPVLAAIGNRSATEGQLFTFSINATDPDGDPLSFTNGGLPAGASLVDNHNGTATFSWTPAAGQAGSYPVTVTVSDGALNASETFTITVSAVAVNHAPVLTNPGNKTVNEGQLLSFTITASDPDGNALTFAATGLPGGATLSPAGAFSWTPSFTQAGSYSVTVTATDNGSPALTSAPQTFTIAVTNVNRAPTVTNPGPKTVTEGQPLSFTITGSDPDVGDVLTYTVTTALPAGATLSPSGAFSWTPATGQAGSYSVTVTATDNGTPPLTSAPQTFTITVNAPAPVNHAPAVTNPGPKTVTEGQLLSFTISGSDPDGNSLSFAATGLPAGATLSASGAFSWTPSFTQAGSYSVTVTATDNGSPALTSAPQTFTITVTNVNRQPTLNAITNKTVTEGQLLSFTITGSDPDGDTLAFAATGLPAGATLSPSGAFSWTPATGQAGTTPYSVTVTATDNGSPALTSAPQTFTITVNAPAPVNHAPTVTNPGPKTVTEGQLLSFTITGSDPDVGDVLTYKATTALPAGATLSPSGAFSWTPATGQAGSYSVTVTATDNGTPALTSAPQTFTITVQAAGTTIDDDDRTEGKGKGNGKGKDH